MREGRWQSGFLALLVFLAIGAWMWMVSSSDERMLVSESQQVEDPDTAHQGSRDLGVGNPREETTTVAGTTQPVGQASQMGPVQTGAQRNQRPQATSVEIQRRDGKYPFIRIERRDDGRPALVMVADHLIVSLKGGGSEQALADSLVGTELDIRKSVTPGKLYLISLAGNDEPDEETLEQIEERLRPAAGQIEFFEPDYLLTISATPNDASFHLLWGMNNTSPPSSSDGDIDAPEAWDLATSAASVVVGVIDTGIDYTHPDLAANMWTNPGEIPGNDLDDDGNGYIDDVHGYDFYNDDGDAMDDHYHGTHCAGTIGAVGNNGVGVAGVAWEVQLMAIKFLGPQGGYTSDAIASVNYATQAGATFTSNSWGGGGYSTALRDAIQNSASVFVAAAGNSRLDADRFAAYPASYELDNIISVAATDREDRLASFSNYGATSVDLAAPGVSVYSTSPGGSYRYLSGTSMATPHVAGACALLLAQDSSLTPGEVKAHLLNTADPIAGLSGKMVSGARLDLPRLLEGLNPTPPVITSESAALAYLEVPFVFQVLASESPAWFEASGLPAGLAINRDSGLITGTPTSLGVSSVVLRAGNAAGVGTATLQITVGIDPPEITSSLARSGQVGAPFIYQITASPEADSFGAVGLPAGLGLDPNIGLITGVPEVTGNFSVSLSATNAGGTDNEVLSLTVAPRPPPQITSPLSMIGAWGVPFSYHITATNSPTSFGALGLPAGLVLDSSSGLISGTPTAIGDFSVLIEASNETATSLKTLQLRISGPGVPEITSVGTAFGQAGEAFTYQIAATNSPTNYGAENLPSGVAVNATSGLISGVPTESGSFSLLVKASNVDGEGSKVVAVTILPPAPVITSVDLLTARVGEPIDYQITSEPLADSFGASGLPAGLTLNPTTGRIRGVVEQSADYPVMLTATGAGGQGSLTLHLEILPRPVPEITSPLSISGQFDRTFSYQITADHEPTSFGASDLPGGLGINAANGQITGTPTVIGSFTVMISATNETGTGSASLALVINPPDAPEITSEGFASGQVGKPFSYQITATHSPSGFGAEGLSGGLSVNAASGLISGTPTEGGVFSIVVKASNLGGEGSQVVVVTILPPTPVISSASTVSARVDEPLLYQITSEPEADSYGASGLPPGLIFDSTTGQIAGIVEQVGTYPVTLSATGEGGTGTLGLSITVLPRPPPEITSPLSITGKFDRAFSYQITASHKPTSFGASGLPHGLEINNTSGVISGTPLEVGNFPVQITAANETGTDSKVLGMTINPPDAPEITSADSASGQEGFAFSYQITASNSPTDFGAAGLPAGLSMNPTTGLVSGVPSESGVFPVLVTAGNLGGEGSQVVTISLLPPAPVITSPETINARRGAVVEYQITSEPTADEFEATGLPDGLQVNPMTGRIYGAVEQVGTYSANVTATGAGGSGSKALSIVILPHPPVVDALPELEFEIGEPVAFQLAASNEPIHFAVDGLPSGIGLDTVTGEVTGMGSAIGSYPLTLRAFNAGGEGTASATLKIVKGPTRILSFSPQTINPHETITILGHGFENTRAVYFSYNSYEWAEAEAIQTISDTELLVTVPYLVQSSLRGSNIIVDTDQGLAVVFPDNTLKVTAGYDAEHDTDGHFIVEGGGAWVGNGFANRVVIEEGGSARETGSGVNTFFVGPGGFLDLSYSSSFNANQVFHTEDAIVLQGVGVASIGLGDFRVVEDIRVTQLSELLRVRQLPRISSASEGAATVGDRFEYKLQVSYPYSPVTHAIGSLPHGMAFDTATGVLSGYPSTPGTYPIPISVTNFEGTTTFTYTLTVAGPPIPVMPGPTRIEASSAEALSHQVEIYNGPASFSATGLPAGLVIHPATGLINGIPTERGVFAVTISATNAHGTSTRAFSVYVDDIPLSIASYDPDTAENDSWITVLGTGFDEVQEVYFVSASFAPLGALAFTLISDTELRVQLPDLNFQGTDGTPIILKGENYSCVALPDGEGRIVESGETYELDSEYRECIYVRSGGTLLAGRYGFSNAVFLEEGAHLDLGDAFPVKSVFKSPTATVTGDAREWTEIVEMSSLSLNHVTEPWLNVYRLPQVYSGDATGNVGDFFSYEIITHNYQISHYEVTGLPPGLEFVWEQPPGSAFIAGVPELPGTHPVEITVREYNGRTGVKTVTFTIGNQPRSRVTNGHRLDVQVGQSINHQITANHTPTSFAANGLPPGVDCSHSGLLTGVISSPGVWKIPVEIQNVHGVSTSTLLLAAEMALPQVTQMPAQTTRGAEILLTGTHLGSVDQVHFLKYYWHNSEGQVLESSENSVRAVTPDSPSLSSSGMFLLVVGEGGASLVGRENSIRVARSGTVTTPRNGGEVWYVESGGTLAFGRNFPELIFAENGSYVDLTTAHPTMSIIHAPNALFIGGETANFIPVNDLGRSIVPNDLSVLPLPTLAVPSLYRAYLDVPFLATITAWGGPTSFGASGLPPGLSLNASAGSIFGTPTDLGEFDVTLSASNIYGTSSKQVTMRVGDPVDYWRDQTFAELEGGGDNPLAGDLADADGDGIFNLLEFAGGLNPLQRDDRAPLFESAQTANGFFEYTFRMRKGAGVGNPVSGYEVDGIRYTVEISYDMLTWHSGSDYLENVGTPVDNSDGTESVTVCPKESIEERPSSAIRVRVERIR